MNTTRKDLVRIAKLEAQAWHRMPRGLALAILFAFIHRVTTGESVEETFFSAPAAVDYEI